MGERRAQLLAARAAAAAAAAMAIGSRRSAAMRLCMCRRTSLPPRSARLLGGRAACPCSRSAAAGLSDHMGRGCGEDGALLQPAPAALAHGRGMCAPAIGPPQCLLHPCRCHAARTMPAPRASRAHNRDGGPRGLGAGIPHAAQSSSSAPAARHSTAPHRTASRWRSLLSRLRALRPRGRAWMPAAAHCSCAWCWSWSWPGAAGVLVRCCLDRRRSPPRLLFSVGPRPWARNSREV